MLAIGEFGMEVVGDFDRSDASHGRLNLYLSSAATTFNTDKPLRLNGIGRCYGVSETRT